MPTLAVYNMRGEQVGDINLRDDVFAAEIKKEAMLAVASMQLANRRQGTAATKTRADVRGGGRKPWRQKGTGRARHGSIRSPIWVGGGTTFGPQPRRYAPAIPKKVRRAALRSALSAKVRDNEMLVLDDLRLEQPRTKAIKEVLQYLKVDSKALLVIDKVDETVIKSARNLPGVKTLTGYQLNVLDILNYDYLIFTRAAARQAEEVFA